MIFIACFALIVGLASGATVICSDYQAGGGGGGLDGYYVRPLPGNCRGRHGSIQNWKPTFKITRPMGGCKGGWKERNGVCYFDRRGNGQGEHPYRVGEEFCNQNQAHIFIPNDREEYLWVEQNVMTHNGWYWMGFFCARSGTRDFNQIYANTREDTRVIHKKLRAELAHPIDEHNTPCMTTHRNNNSWRWRYHHRHGHESHCVVCEAPMG